MNHFAPNLTRLRCSNAFDTLLDSFNENLSVRCDCTLKSDGADKKSLVPIPIGTSYSIAGALRVKKFSISINLWMVDRCMLLTRVLKGGEKKMPNFSIHLQLYFNPCFFRQSTLITLSRCSFRRSLMQIFSRYWDWAAEKKKKSK